MTAEICRLCLADSPTVHSVFEHNVKELAEMISDCTVVEILRDDELPKGACANCIEMVIKFNYFKKQCQYSNNILKQKYSKNLNFTCEFNDEIEPTKKCNNDSNDCVILSNLYKTRGRFDMEISKDATSIKSMRIKGLRNNQNSKTEHTRHKNCKTNNQSLMQNCNPQCSTDDDDDNISNNSDSNCNDPNYRPPSELGFYLDPVGDPIIALAPKSKKVPLRKKKCKIKRRVDKTKQEKDNVRHHLVYTEQDYAILGRERKVRIYEMDHTLKEIIGHNVYACEICLMQFESFFEYYDHQEAHNGELVFKCSKCSEIFPNRQDLVDHDARHKIPCQVCELEVLPKSMSAHLLIHTDVHKCPDCGMRHTSNASLEKHIKARHTGIKGFVCHVCGKQSSCQSSMNRHMAYHSNERPYKCKYCDFCAKSLNIVQVHTSRKHFAEKCVCEICAKLFKSQPSLLQHMKRIHTARKHICDICGKAFIERYNLNRHLKKHAGQRLHECKICHKEFFTIRKLKEHMHTHRQGCVNCPKCGKEFFYKKYYTKHVLKCTTDDKIAVNNSDCVPLISGFK